MGTQCMSALFSNRSEMAMTDHAAAVEAVRARHQDDDRDPEYWMSKADNARDAHADRATLLRAYEMAVDTNNELSLEIASLLSERRNRK